MSKELVRLRNEQMKTEINAVKERDKCEECAWFKNIGMCNSCRLFDGNSYFLPNLYIRRVNA